MRKVFLITILTAINFLLLNQKTVIAQEKLNVMELTNFKHFEDTLMGLSDSMYAAYIPEQKEAFAQLFAKKLVQTLKFPNSYTYPFDSLQKKINIIQPDDKSFKIFNWSIAPQDNTNHYFGAIQMPNESLKLYGLVDLSNEYFKGWEDTTLTAPNWLGCLYYKIITNKVENKKIYTLFGFNSADRLSNRKVLEPLYFDENGAEFGAPIFNILSEKKTGQPINRFILEYKKEAQASLNWDVEKNAIFFDKLVSQTNDPNRKYTFVPSGQYDGLRWENEHWVFVPDLIPINLLKDGEAPSEK